ncbi:hypothetical protein LCGC14_0812480 [marine sediment metagenome]|uniref:Uncharacterized protein n=1 Tax=marine sediment metagenome TaxID=412755 RepID=A0A0F9STL0_9ZZZZ
MATYYRGGRSITISDPRSEANLRSGGWSTQRPSAPRITGRSGGGGMDPAALEALTKAKAYYESGGDFGKGVEAGLERERTQAMSSGMQSLVASGFAGTTMAAGLGKKFAEEVGMPTRARIEETRAERLSALDVLKAQLTQGASESAQQRALQEFITRMSSETSLALGGMRGGGDGARSPSIQYAPQSRNRTATFTGGGLPSNTGAGAAMYGIGDDSGMPTMAPFGGNVYGSQEAFEQNIPGQYTPSAMDEYLKTYVPKSGDFSTFSWGA